MRAVQAKISDANSFHFDRINQILLWKMQFSECDSIWKGQLTSEDRE